MFSSGTQVKYRRYSVQEDVHVVHQGLESEERGRKGSGMKMSAESWARAVNPVDRVYEQGLSAALQSPRAPGQPTEGPERGLELALSTDGVSLPLSKIYRASVIPPRRKEGEVNRCIKVQSRQASPWGVRPAVRNTSRDHSHVGDRSLLPGLFAGSHLPLLHSRETPPGRLCSALGTPA